MIRTKGKEKAMRIPAILSLCLTMAANANPPTTAQIELYQACRGDIKRLCGSVPAGGGAIAECLKENQSKISQACVEAFVRYRVSQEPAPQSATDPATPPNPPPPPQ